MSFKSSLGIDDTMDPAGPRGTKEMWEYEYCKVFLQYCIKNKHT